MFFKTSPYLAIVLLVMTGTSQLLGASEDEKLQALFKDYLEEVFKEQPLTATSLGDHRYDAKLDDISPEARARWRTRAQRMLVELPQRVSQGQLSRDGQIDF